MIVKNVVLDVPWKRKVCIRIVHAKAQNHFHQDQIHGKIIELPVWMLFQSLVVVMKQTMIK